MGKEQQKLFAETAAQEEDTIDLLRLLKALWHRAWALILAAVLLGGAAFGYSAYMVTPLYESTAMLYVNNSSFSIGSTSYSISTGELSAAQSLIDTYVVILETRTTLEQVIEEAEVDYTYEELLAMIDADDVNSTEIFSVTVTDADPVEAALLANTIAEILPERISEIVEGSSVYVVDEAVVSTVQASPNVMKYTVVGALAGFVIAAFIIIVLELFDDVIHGEDYLLQTYNLPILAAIPDLASKSGGGYYGNYYGNYRKR